MSSTYGGDGEGERGVLGLKGPRGRGVSSGEGADGERGGRGESGKCKRVRGEESTCGGGWVADTTKRTSFRFWRTSGSPTHLTIMVTANKTNFAMG